MIMTIPAGLCQMFFNNPYASSGELQRLFLFPVLFDGLRFFVRQLTGIFQSGGYPHFREDVNLHQQIDSHDQTDDQKFFHMVASFSAGLRQKCYPFVYTACKKAGESIRIELPLKAVGG